MKKSVKIVLICLCVVFVIIFGFSAFKIISTLNGYKQAEKTYSDIASQFVTVAEPVKTEDKTDKKDEKKPEELEVSPISNVDFAGLKAQCQDYAAWIYSPNTVINYPVVYTDNNFYYLDHIPVEQHSTNGTLFIDCECASDFTGKNTLIYGHNMNDGSMFASLRDYRDPAYYPEHPVIYLSTPDFNYRLDIIAGFVTEPTSLAYCKEFDTEEQFMAYIEWMRSISTFESDVEVGEEDQVVTLSTCTYEVDDGRYCIVGKLVKIR